MGGFLFNPWLNVSVCLILTLGLGWLTSVFWGWWMDAINAPAYGDRDIDIIGGFIGVVVAGLATLALFVVTIWVIAWWIKSNRKRG